MHRRFLLTLPAAALVLLPATRLLADSHGRTGAFTGQSGHSATGTAEIAGARVALFADFSFDGAPDPVVGLGRGGFDPATLMGPLTSNSGASSYTVPAGIDAAAYDEVWIWCKQFRVPLGVAKLG